MNQYHLKAGYLAFSAIFLSTRRSNPGSVNQRKLKKNTYKFPIFPQKIQIIFPFNCQKSYP